MLVKAILKDEIFLLMKELVAYNLDTFYEQNKDYILLGNEEK